MNPMKYKSELADDLIEKSGADVLLVMSELKKAHTLQTVTYSDNTTIHKVPIVITYKTYKDEKPSYGFHFDSDPQLGKEFSHQHYPTHTEYNVAVLRPVI